jgi:O-antigen/teichoic acid export membrane protein
LEPPGRSIGSRILTGGAWIALQSIIAQALALLARIVLFRRLTPEEIAAAAWSLSAGAFFLWMQPAIADLLVQRQRHFRRWSGAGFRLALFSALLMIATGLLVGAPLGILFGNWRVAPLFAISIATSAVLLVSSVWTAELSIQYRFRRIALIASCGSLCTAGLTIAMACLDAGSWSMVVPALASAVLVALLLRASASFRPAVRSAPRHLSSFARPAFMLALAAFFLNLIMQVDNFFVGLYLRDSLAAYMLAFACALQLVQMLSRGLRSTILPAFSALAADPARRDAAYLQSLRLVSWLSMPMSILPILGARFVTVSLFTTRWTAVVPLLQVFLAGMGFNMVWMLGVTFIQALGRFRRYLLVSALHGLLFTAVVWIVSATATAQGVAIAVTAAHVLAALVWVQLAPRNVGVRFRRDLFLAPLLPFLLAGAAALGGARLRDACGYAEGEWLGAVVAMAAGGAGYLLLSLLLMRDTMRTALLRIRDAARREKRSSARAA